MPAAIGYAEQVKSNIELGIIRNHYVGRTFIEPTQKIRSFGVKLKHSINKTLIENKSIVLIDDSLVRGTTSLKIVKMLYESGAKEVHLRVASPPIKYPDFYGVDTPNQNELLASKFSLEEIRKVGRFIAELNKKSFKDDAEKKFDGLSGGDGAKLGQVKSAFRSMNKNRLKQRFLVGNFIEEIA